MTREETLNILKESINKPVRIHYKSGGAMSAIILNVDSEGFVYKNVAGPTTDVPSAATLVTLDGRFYWTQFEAVAELFPISN